LVHRFGAKEQILESILGPLRERMLAAAREALGEQPDLPRAARAAWPLISDPKRAQEFRLFVAVYGRALPPAG
jgi:hypothetical protein